MNNKQINYSRKYRKEKHMMEEYTPPNEMQGPVIFSCEDVRRMAVEASRARLNSNLVRNQEYSPKEFSSYFLGPTKETDPPYSITSHTAAAPILKRKPIVPLPSLGHTLRWNPNVETSSVETSQTDLVQKKFNCRCESCSMRNCPSRISSSITIKPSIFRDNIMTFCDRYTMTPVKNDVGCGILSIHSIPRMSDVSITTPIYNVKDTQAIVHQLYSQKCAPLPILKRNEYNESENNNYSCHENRKGKITRCKLHEEAERDTDVTHDCFDDREQEKTKFKIHKQLDCDHQRKNIYNEGISDRIANQFPVKPMHIPCPVNLNRDYSKVSVMNKSFIDADNQIPYSHKSNSKYHYSCKRCDSAVHYDSDGDEFRRLVGSPQIIRKTYKKPLKYNKVSISMPKKVLTSERDIESYIEKSYPKVLIPDARRR